MRVHHPRRGRLGCGGSERSSARVRSCTTLTRGRCVAVARERIEPLIDGVRATGSSERVPGEACVGCPGSRWRASWRLTWAEPRHERLVAFLWSCPREGVTPSRAALCCLRRPHTASGSLLSAATLTNPSRGNECLLAAALRANSLKQLHVDHQPARRRGVPPPLIRTPSERFTDH